MGEIYYNPWKSAYKSPFGAIQEGQSARFGFLGADSGIDQVYLVIEPEGQKAYRIKMTPQENGFFQTEFAFTDGKGLYFYHFELEYLSANQQRFTRYYGWSGENGHGEVRDYLKECMNYQVTCYQKAEKAPDWYRQAVFYQIFPDRFFNGNPDGHVNNPKENTFLYGDLRDDPMYIKDAQGEVLRWDFYGGNFAGIQAKIPYLKELGVNALYLNPIFEARSNHRYDTADYLKVDPILGTEAEFQELLDTLHQEGFRVILDGVFSHVGRHSRYFNYDGAYGPGVGAYQDIKSPYFPWFTFLNYPNEYRSWWGVKDLPEVNKENEEFQRFIYGAKGVLSKWNQMGLDGWRLDVADELPDEFIAGIRNNLDHYEDKVLLGEVWEDASNKVSYGVRRQYILGDHLHGVMNYPLRSATIDFLMENCSPEDIALVFTRLQENYPREVFYNSLNNIGTHDTERILSQLEGDYEKLSLAFALLVTFPGVPCIYYGDEAGLTGGKDPDNRKFFPWGRVDETCYRECRKWLALRKENHLLQGGEFGLIYSERLLGVLRYDETQFILTVLNPLGVEVIVSAKDFAAFRELPLTRERLAVLLEGQRIRAHGSYVIEGELSE